MEDAEKLTEEMLDEIAATFGSVEACDRESTDPRDEITEAVTWALTEIGKRNVDLTAAVLHAAEKLETMQTPSARRIGKSVSQTLQNPDLAHYNYPKEKYGAA